MDDQISAEKLHHEASAAYLAASTRYEAAAMSGDRDARAAARAALGAAGEAYARTMADMVAARRVAAPSFEGLLADPTSQPDSESRVLASILAYAAAQPATAGRALTTATAHLFPAEAHRVSVHSGAFTDRLVATAGRLTAAC